MGFVSNFVKILSIPLIIISTCYVGLLFIEKYEERQAKRYVKELFSHTSETSRGFFDEVADVTKWLEGKKKKQVQEQQKDQKDQSNAPVSP
ncbi:MAG: hypothetical protein ACPGC9_00400 [Cytophagales bacterium]